MGGDEFAILARNLPGAEGATNIGLRIIEALTPPVIIADTHHTVGAAVGVAMAAQDGETADELLRRADVALYRATANRASSLRFFEPDMDARLHERKRSLQDAVAEGAFALRFQLTCANSHTIAGFEAVPIWIHPTLGELGPERFLPIAEEAGLLATLTEQLLRQACTIAAEWPSHIQMSMNLPGALLTNPTFGRRILDTLIDTGFAPSRFSLEIDEGGLFREVDAAKKLLAPLQSAGIAIVADNFGTGYSDLQNLHRLKLDGIKLDRSFVAAMVEDRQAAAIVRALIGIGHGLDLSVAANGVVTEAQKAELAAQGCELGQGALYAGLLSAEDATALVTPPKRIKATA